MNAFAKYVVKRVVYNDGNTGNQVHRPLKKEAKILPFRTARHKYEYLYVIHIAI